MNRQETKAPKKLILGLSGCGRSEFEVDF